MTRKITLAILLAALTASTVSAQAIYTPPRGSEERKAILDALRIPVERDLKQKIVFNAENFRVMGSWAFIGGDPQTPSGGRPNYRGTRYWEAVRSDAFDNNFFALMRKTGSKWRVVTYAIGCTDVCYADWWRRHRAPKAIFPYTE
ncbi:MAG TPA: hypothetical protein PKD26_06555 [Pyrinomonadaceae bacterium]|nr:hypothetical protein [Pyrinomonadaceae bacterium]